MPGIVSHAPARLEDVAPTVLAMLGVPPTGMQGSILADAMQAPTSSEVRTQQALNTTLSPVVDALATQSAQELARKK
jgi:arylsulfatase A-like enzyme